MTATNTFYLWFYYGLGNLGGWFIFFLVAIFAASWCFYDSSKRRLPAQSWRLGIFITTILVLPTVLYRFTVRDVSDIVSSPLGKLGEPIFYLGVLGGILPIMIAIGYYITFKGLKVCSRGHLYETVLGNCPHPDHLSSQNYRPHTTPKPKEDADESLAPLRPSRKRVNAWLITLDDRRNYQLYVDETHVGRSIKNDIVLDGDKTVSRESVRIKEQEGRFRLYPVNPGRYPRINNYIVQKPTLLEPDDEIQFGENTILKFVTSR